MAEYNISLGVILESDDLQRIRTQINKLELDPIKIQLDTSNVQNQLNHIRTQIQNLSGININLGAGAGGVGGAAGNMRNLARGADDVTRAYRELISLQNRIGSKQQMVAKLDTTQNQREIMELSTQIDNLYGRYQRLHSLFSGQFSAGQVDALNRNFQVTSERLSVVNQKVADVKANLASSIQGNFGAYDAKIVSLETRFSGLGNKAHELRVGIDTVKQSLEAMKIAAQSGDQQALIANWEIYKQKLKEVEAQLRLNTEAERQANNTAALAQSKQNLSLKMNNWLKDNSAAAKQFGGEIQQLQVQLNQCGNTSGLSQVAAGFENVKLRAKEAGVATQTFGHKIKEQFSKYSAYFSVYTLFMYSTMALRNMFNQVKEIDSAMTELKKVTNETESSYNQFLTNAASRAKALGTTIDGLVKSTADFARLGYSFKDAQGLAEVANIYAVVGDEIEGVEEATKSLISTMAAFKEQARGLSNEDFAMDIVDKFNEIGKLIA